MTPPQRLSRRQFVSRSTTLGSAAAIKMAQGQSSSGTSTGKLQAGAATTNITPNLGCSLTGGMRPRFAEDVHDELHVRGLVLDNGQTRLAFAICDATMLPGEVMAQAKELIRRHTGIAEDHVLIAATHTHSSPRTADIFQSEAVDEYVDRLPDRISDCVRMAVHRLEPARIGWGAGQEESLVFNRRFFLRPGTMPPNPFGLTDRVKTNPGVRNPDVVKAAGPTDPEVGIVAVESMAGRPICLLGNYALHYVGGTGRNHVSADYFACWANTFSRMIGLRDSGRYPPFVAMLTNGCSGDINNIDVSGPRLRHPPYFKMQQVADILAAESYRVWRDIEFRDSVRLGASVEDLEFGVRLPGIEEVNAARKVLAAAPPAGEMKAQRHIYARETVLLSEGFPSRVTTLVQAFRIGELGIATFPGEAFVELGLEVKAKTPFEKTFLVELANDYRGYIPTVEHHELGGYETWRARSSYLEVGAASRLVASALRQLETLART